MIFLLAPLGAGGAAALGRRRGGLSGRGTVEGGAVHVCGSR